MKVWKSEHQQCGSGASQLPTITPQHLSKTQLLRHASRQLHCTILQAKVAPVIMANLYAYVTKKHHKIGEMIRGQWKML